jgi:hypothetical protein
LHDCKPSGQSPVGRADERAGHQPHGHIRLGDVRGGAAEECQSGGEEGQTYDQAEKLHALAHCDSSGCAGSRQSGPSLLALLTRGPTARAVFSFAPRVHPPRTVYHVCQLALAYHELPPELIGRHASRARPTTGAGRRRSASSTDTRRRDSPSGVRGNSKSSAGWRGDSRALPCTGWTWQGTVEAGEWSQWEAEPMDVPATLALENGVWYRVNEGIQGLLVADEAG